MLLPKDQVVLEILESVEPDEEVVEACKKLKRLGYLIALDDFVYRESFTPLLKFVDIIKVDFLSTNAEERKQIHDRIQASGQKRFLAEKLETQEDFEEASELGYHYFQGYFFSRPVILTRRGMVGNRQQIFKILRDIHEPGMDFRELENSIKQDVALSYKLLRYINSAFFGLQTEIHSIRHALVLMGESEIKKWATLVSLATMGEEKPAELMVNASIRGKACEILAKETGNESQASDFFLMGLFSLIDAILDHNLVEVLHDLPLAREIKSALLRVAQNQYRMAFEVVLAYEQGNWRALAKWAGKPGIEEGQVAQIYLESVKWANQIHGLTKD
jgi:EAL and modified HD-GYP domain-containing signal transduction protein